MFILAVAIYHMISHRIRDWTVGGPPAQATEEAPWSQAVKASHAIIIVMIIMTIIIIMNSSSSSSIHMYIYIYIYTHRIYTHRCTFTHSHEGWGELWWRYLSKATCLIRPHLFYACFDVSRIIIICYTIRHFWRSHVLDN